MWGQVAQGAGAACSATSAAHKLVLGRGCDPVMAAHSASFLPPLLSGARVQAFSSDVEFFAELDRMRLGQVPKADVVFFAPGACRWDAARQPIPGGIPGVSHGWGLAEYHARVREALGEDVSIVGTAREAEIVPLLRAALKLQ